MSSNDEADWKQYADEDSFEPNVVFGFGVSPMSKQKEFAQTHFAELVGTTGGFSNSYASYIDLDTMADNLAQFLAILKTFHDAQRSNQSLGVNIWWTPSIFLTQRKRNIDFCSMRNLTNCESFLTRSISDQPRGNVASGNIADYNDFDYIHEFTLHFEENKLYYKDHWVRGYVSDDNFDPSEVDEPHDYRVYVDPDYSAYREKARLALPKFQAVKKALVELLGDAVLTQKYFRL